MFIVFFVLEVDHARATRAYCLSFLKFHISPRYSCPSVDYSPLSTIIGVAE